MGNLVTSEPISASTVAVVVTWVATYFALNLDAATATSISVVVLALTHWLARALSVPLAKHDKIVKTVAQAASK